MPKRAVIELSPTRTEIAVVKGARVERRAAALHTEPAQDRDAMLAAAARVLPELVKRCGVVGAEATVIYHSGSTVCAVLACPKAAGPAGAERAARLALAESSELPLELSPHGLRPVFSDRPSGSGTPALQVHTLGVVDSDESARAVAAAVSAAGLEPKALVPAGAAAIAAACAGARLLAPGGVGIVLYVGEQGSVLAGFSHGRLKFVREVAIGTEAFVDALAREIRPSQPGTGAVQLDREQARALVMSVGIPSRSQDVDPARGLRGDAILPLMQPVVQRYSVEIRQSLRFGFDEAEREGAVLIGAGPGARVPRMIALIAEPCGLKVGEESEPRSEGAGVQAGLIDEYLESGAAGVALLPRHLGRQTNLRAVQRALWTGIAAAGVLVGGDAFMTRRDLTAKRAEIALLEKNLSGASGAEAVRDACVAATAGVAGARTRMAERMTSGADWDAVLGAVSASTPARIRLAEIDMRLENGRATLRLSGMTPLTGGPDGAIKEYLDALSAIPVVRSCRLGATQRSESTRGPMQAFDMTLSLVEVPPDVPGSAGAPAQASVTREDQP